MALFETIGNIGKTIQFASTQFSDMLDELSGTKKKDKKSGDKKESGLSLSFGSQEDNTLADLVAPPLADSDLLELILKDQDFSVSKFIGGI